MKGIYIQSGLQLTGNVLNYFQNSKDFNSGTRQNDYFSLGLLRESQTQLETREFEFLSSYPYVTVGSGTAYKSGERMLIDIYQAYGTSVIEILDTDVTASATTGNQNIQLTSGNGTYYLWIRYEKLLDLSAYTLHPVSCEPLYYKEYDGYYINMIFNNANNPDTDKYVYLGKVTLSGTTITADYTGRIFSAVDSTTIRIPAQPYGNTLYDHITAIGHASVTCYNAHGLSATDIPGLENLDIAAILREGFNDGIYDINNNALGTCIRTTPLSYCGCLYDSGGVVIHQLLADETIYLDGNRAKEVLPLIQDASGWELYEVPTDSFVPFCSTDAAGIWYIALCRQLPASIQPKAVAYKTTSLAGVQIPLASVCFTGLGVLTSITNLKNYGLTYSNQMKHDSLGVVQIDSSTDIYGDLYVSGNAYIAGCEVVTCKEFIHSCSVITCDLCVCGNSYLGNAASDYALICGCARLSGYFCDTLNSCVQGNATIGCNWLSTSNTYAGITGLSLCGYGGFFCSVNTYGLCVDRNTAGYSIYIAKNACVASCLYTGSNIYATGNICTAAQLISIVATSTAPFVVNSSTVVGTLNVDCLDGYHAGNSTGQIPLSNGTCNTNLNADMLDGYHASSFAAGITVTQYCVPYAYVANTLCDSTMQWKNCTLIITGVAACSNFALCANSGVYGIKGEGSSYGMQAIGGSYGVYGCGIIYGVGGFTSSDGSCAIFGQAPNQESMGGYFLGSTGVYATTNGTTGWRCNYDPASSAAICVSTALYAYNPIVCTSTLCFPAAVCAVAVNTCGVGVMACGNRFGVYGFGLNIAGIYGCGPTGAPGVIGSSNGNIGVRGCGSTGICGTGTYAGVEGNGTVGLLGNTLCVAGDIKIDGMLWCYVQGTCSLGVPGTNVQVKCLTFSTSNTGHLLEVHASTSIYSTCQSCNCIFAQLYINGTAYCAQIQCNYGDTGTGMTPKGSLSTHWLGCITGTAQCVELYAGSSTQSGTAYYQLSYKVLERLDSF